jgi:hypothetical protein
MSQEIPFKKNIGTKTLQLFNENGTHKTILTNSRNESIVLEEFVNNPMSLGTIGNNQHNWFNIVDGTIHDNVVYVLYYNFGLVELKTYHFTQEKKFTTSTYFIDKQPLLTWDNGGNISYFVEMKWFGTNLYMYITAKQQYGGKKTEGLYQFKSIASKIYYINFSEPEHIIKDEDKTFDTLDLDKNKEIVSNEIRKALLNIKDIKETDKLDYIGFIDDISSCAFNNSYKRRSQGSIMFLYKINKSETKIVRYNNYKFKWQIGDYTEEEIKQPD